jgi:hypothetical protein
MLSGCSVSRIVEPFLSSILELERVGGWCWWDSFCLNWAVQYWSCNYVLCVDVGCLLPFAGGSGRGGRRQRRGEDVVHPLKVSLEDLYNGTSKKLSLSRNILCPRCKGWDIHVGLSCFLLIVMQGFAFIICDMHTLFSCQANLERCDQEVDCRPNKVCALRSVMTRGFAV